jgi:signal transduction histidine kinase
MGDAGRAPCRDSQTCPVARQGEGMLHDARNLMGALGLYCDLLSMPGVLKPEHNHYPEELRLLGTRSSTLIEHLMQSLLAQGSTDDPCLAAADKTGKCPGRLAVSASPVKPAGLRCIVERCSGLLSRVAGGRVVEVSYGVAAGVPVQVSEEAVERILVNLVRNASAALDKHRRADDPAVDATGNAERLSAGSASGSLRESLADGTEDETPGAIRIGVGLLVNRVGDPRPWPFRRVRITVEDSGCGMTSERLERLLCGGRAPSRGNHGIGFRVVRELVAASDGDLRVMSAPEVGTRVQIEWPMAVMSAKNTMESWDEPREALSLDCGTARVQKQTLSDGSPDRIESGPSSRRSADSRTEEGWGSC